LLELIATMTIIAIMAFVALPRLANPIIFQTRGFADQTVATLQYARKVAVASGRNVCASASSGDDKLTMTMATARGEGEKCSAGNVVAKPAANWKTFSGITYGSGLSPIFRGDGSATAVGSFTVAGDSIYTIVIEPTGYVHCDPVAAC
jgi:MSHA pilin protein MshC